jgi:hypothetical protein
VNPRLAACDNPRSGTPGSPRREPRECISGFKKRGFPQLALRASKHELFLKGTGEAALSKPAARRRVVWYSCYCSATGVPNRIAKLVRAIKDFLGKTLRLQRRVARDIFHECLKLLDSPQRPNYSSHRFSRSLAASCSSMRLSAISRSPRSIASNKQTCSRNASTLTAAGPVSRTACTFNFSIRPSSFPEPRLR